MAISDKHLKRDHVLDLVDGRLAESGSSPGKRSRPEDLAAIFKKIRQDPHGKNLVIHFHGGLVSRGNAMSGARDLYPTYRDAGAYPLFVVWNSGLLKQLVFNLDEIAKEPAFRRLLFRIGQFLVGKLDERPGARGAGVKLPSPQKVPDDLKGLAGFLAEQETDRRFRDPSLRVPQERQLERVLRRDKELSRAARDIAAGLRDPEEVRQSEVEYRRSRGASPLVTSTSTLMSRSVIKKIERDSPRPGARGVVAITTLVRYGVRIARSVLVRYRKGHDHGLYTTIVEETLRTLYLDNAGIVVWNMMKKDTLDAFGGDKTRDGGTALLGQMDALWRQHQRVTLVGHSTGAIYIGNLISEAHKALPERCTFDVLYMAPACTVDFLDKRLPVFRKRVDHFRSFGLSDELEHGYWEVPVLYNASLLYMVSGILEEAGADTPLVGMERYFTSSAYKKDNAVGRVARYLEGEEIWSVVDDGFGRASAAKRHGGFDQEKITKASQSFILQSGF